MDAPNTFALKERRNKGSRKHLLRFLDDSSYPKVMSKLLRCHGAPYAIVSEGDKRQPLGTRAHDEWEIPKFCREHGFEWLDVTQVERWWLPLQPKMPKGPTWDLLSTCTIKDKPGLLLVEAKAHERELCRTGKSKPSGSAQSAANDLQIRNRLAEVSKELRSRNWDVDVNAERHY